MRFGFPILISDIALTFIGSKLHLSYENMFDVFPATYKVPIATRI